MVKVTGSERKLVRVPHVPRAPARRRLPGGRRVEKGPRGPDQIGETDRLDSSGEGHEQDEQANRKRDGVSQSDAPTTPARALWLFVAPVQRSSLSWLVRVERLHPKRLADASMCKISH